MVAKRFPLAYRPRINRAFVFGVTLVVTLALLAFNRASTQAQQGGSSASLTLVASEGPTVDPLDVVKLTAFVTDPCGIAHGQVTLQVNRDTSHGLDVHSTPPDLLQNPQFISYVHNDNSDAHAEFQIRGENLNLGPNLVTAQYTNPDCSGDTLTSNAVELIIPDSAYTTLTVTPTSPRIASGQPFAVQADAVGVDCPLKEILPHLVFVDLTTNTLLGSADFANPLTPTPSPTSSSPPSSTETFVTLAGSDDSDDATAIASLINGSDNGINALGDAQATAMAAMQAQVDDSLAGHATTTIATSAMLPGIAKLGLHTILAQLVQPLSSEGYVLCPSTSTTFSVTVIGSLAPQRNSTVPETPGVVLLASEGPMVRPTDTVTLTAYVDDPFCQKPAPQNIKLTGIHLDGSSDSTITEVGSSGDSGDQAHATFSVSGLNLVNGVPEAFTATYSNCPGSTFAPSNLITLTAFSSPQTVLTLSTSTNPEIAGQPWTIDAHIQGAGCDLNGSPQMISFVDTGTNRLLGSLSVPIAPNGNPIHYGPFGNLGYGPSLNASFTLPSLSIGTHTILAQYNPGSASDRALLSSPVCPSAVAQIVVNVALHAVLLPTLTPAAIHFHPLPTATNTVAVNHPLPTPTHVIIHPPPTPAATEQPTACVPRADWLYRYVIQRGDNLGIIALKLNMRTADLQVGNCVTDPLRLIAGQTLHVPRPAPTPTPRPTPTFTPAPVQLTMIGPNLRADSVKIYSIECTTIRWDVDNIKAVYFENQPSTGHNSQKVCPTETTTYTLMVEMLDGKSQPYPITITVEPYKP